MKGDRLLIILALVVLVVGGICGFAIHGWTTAPCPEYVATPQSETHALDSAARAQVYASGYTDGRASIVPEVRTITVAGRTRVETVVDPQAIEDALRAYSVIDSLMTVIGERDGILDITAQDVVEVPDHRLDLRYSIRERSFRGSSVTCTRPDTSRIVEIPEVRTWWDRWSVGATAGPAAVYVPGEGFRAGLGLMVGLQYAF